MFFWSQGDFKNKTEKTVTFQLDRSKANDSQKVERSTETTRKQAVRQDASKMTTEELLRARRDQPRKPPLPGRDTWQPKSTFQSKTEEAEFRKITKTRLENLAKRRQEAVKKKALDRHLVRDQAHREEQDMVVC